MFAEICIVWGENRAGTFCERKSREFTFIGIAGTVLSSSVLYGVMGQLEWDAKLKGWMKGGYKMDVG